MPVARLACRRSLTVASHLRRKLWRNRTQSVRHVAQIWSSVGTRFANRRSPQARRRPQARRPDDSPTSRRSRPRRRRAPSRCRTPCRRPRRCSRGVDACFAHRREHHAGIGLRWRIVRGLDRDEVVEQPVMRRAPDARRAAICRSRCRARCRRGARVRRSRLRRRDRAARLAIPRGAHRMERVPVVPCEARDRKAPRPSPSFVKASTATVRRPRAALRASGNGRLCAP